MWSDYIEYFKDPLLVAKIQEFFGIRIHNNNKQINDREESNKEAQKYKVQNINLRRDLYDDEKLPKISKTVVADNRNGNTTIAKTRIATNIKNCNSKKDYGTGAEEKNSKSKTNSSPQFTITNNFWYYLFLFGTELGDEIFYSTFIPFWFWNIDGAVGRRMVLVWAVVMTIGQCLKDILRWPRPACPPAARIQNKWSQEYGMPSTHAMIAVSIPFSVVLFTMNRYVYSFNTGLTIAVLWCTLVCVSRLYLGMHTVLDIFAGIALAVFIMIPLVPLVDATDYHLLTKDWALAILVAISIATVVYYPCSDKWTPTRGDTAMVVSVTTGVHVGAWLNYKTGAMSMPLLPPPYNIIWPSYPMLGNTILRTILGFCCVLGTKALCKFLSYATMCAILKVNSKELLKSQNCLENRNKVLVDLVYKYISCFMIGLNAVYLLPNVFSMIGIERPTFYTEI